MRPGIGVGALLNGVGQLTERHGKDVALELGLAATTGGASAGFRVVSRIARHPGLVRHASRLEGTIQRSIDHLTDQLAKGNLNPGIGTKHLFGDVFEARARDGARVYFRNAGENTLEVVGKSTKDNQDQVIKLLKDLYDK